MIKELLTYKDPKSPVSEVFRTLRTNIQFMNTDRKLRTILVTSTFPGEGKSWVTANLAVTFAQTGKRVILVDADMRKGRQYNIFGALPKPGLSNYLSNMGIDDMENSEDVSVTNYIQETDVPNLHLLTAGNVPPNPSELLVSRRMKHLLQELKDECDLIVIDGTPCDLVTDSIILSRIVDSTIIVTAQKETKKENLTRIVKNIKNVGGRIAGVIVNKVEVSAKKYNQSYYYGFISNSNTSSKRSRRDNKKMDEYFSSNTFSDYDMDDDGSEIESTTDTLKEIEEKIAKNKNKFEIDDMPKALKNEKNNKFDFKQDDSYKDVFKEDKDKGDSYVKKINSLKEKLDNNFSYNYDEQDEAHNEKNDNYESKDNNYQDYKKDFLNDIYKNRSYERNNKYQEVEAQVESEGKISEVKIDKNMDEKTKEILRQVNEYIETEKRRQGEKY